MIRYKTIVTVAAAAGMVVGAVCALGQSRREVQISSPGRFRNVGSSGTSTFNAYSYGIGALQPPSAGPSGNLLRSAIDSGASYAISRPGGGSPLDGTSVQSLAPGTTRLYSPMTGLRSGLGGPGAYERDSLSSGSRLLRATSSYLDSLGGRQDVGIATRLAPLTSLAPEGSDPFSRYMSQGEQAFRTGDFETALEQFKMANTVDPKNPESLLSMAHASFAMSRNSYYRAAYYLTQATKFLPELPLAPLQPQSFFTSPQDYAQRVTWLDQHLQSNPFDNSAFFVAAYFRWFNQDVEGARDALARARRGKVAPELLEAIDTFWDGMKASGKISGTLEGGQAPEPVKTPASQPAPLEPAAAAK